MSVSVSRESISKLMTELVDSFPMEAEGRSSISDFGKLLFAEGNASGANASENGAAQVKKEATIEEGDENEENDEDEEDDDDNDEDEEGVDDEMTPAPAAAGTKRVFTEIKGVPRQKHHDVQCVVTDSGKIAISHGSMNKLMKSKEKAVPKRWTTEEDERLRQAVAKHGERNWKSIAEEVPGRNHTQCLQRWTKVLAPGLVKGHWRPDEDELLKELVAEGRKNWGQVANRIPGRTSKQCRERWYNHLDPSIVRGEYTAEEDRIILEAQSRLGNKWSTIAAMLPGRTEDAVKIRWKSLCRVRKGQNRRSGAQAQPGDKVKGPNGKPVVPSGFNGNLVKSEELRAFTAIPTQATPMGRVPLVQPQMMGHAGMPMGSVPTMVAYAPPGSYPAAMGGYAKTVVMTPVNSYGQAMAPVLAVPTSEAFNLDRRANVVNISSPSSGAYRQVYAASSAQYGVDANGNVYSHGGVPTYMTSSGAPMYRVQGGAPAMMATHMHSQMGPSTGMSYGYSMHGMPPTPSSGEYGAPPQYNQSMNPGEAYAAAAHYNHQQQHQQQHASHEASRDRQQESSQSATPVPNSAANFAKSMSQPSSNKPASQPPSLAAAFAQSLGNTPKAASASPAAMFAQNLSNKSANPPSAVSPAAAFAQKAAAAAAAAKSSTPTSNPAAMFAQNLATKAPTPSNGHQNKPSPVAAFLQKQNSENSGGNSPKRANSSSSTGPVPFNPAAAFAQRLQKPPMPSSSSSVKSTDEDEGMSEDGDEPSLKKVKPRNSIDMAARASAARRMRNSGTGNSLMGRRSLDVFLNEIGDVGRISDLKMDEFQTMDELWRVSGDMDRLSL